MKDRRYMRRLLSEWTHDVHDKVSLYISFYIHIRTQKEQHNTNYNKTHMAVPSPQSTNLTTKLTAGIQPDAHSFFSTINLHPNGLLNPLVNGFRFSISEATVPWRSPSSRRQWWARRRGGGIGRVILILLRFKKIPFVCWYRYCYCVVFGNSCKRNSK